MRGRALLWISLGVNVALAALWWYFPRGVEDTSGLLAVKPAAADPDRIYKTNVVVRRQKFTWDEIESGDYPTYIANLCTIGCPESTIRKSMVADVYQLFYAGRATEVVNSGQQW